MYINEILSLLANICIYYYITYHEKLKHEIVTVPEYVKLELMKRIYHGYMSSLPKCCNDGYVDSLLIMDGVYYTEYTLTDIDEPLDVNKIINDIDEYIDRNKEYYCTSIYVISLSPHPIENYIQISHDWIKSVIDLYRY